MRKERRYKKTLIQVCRNCQGSGTVAADPATSADPKKQITCPVCEGSGRVNKLLDIDITIEPYRDKDK